MGSEPINNLTDETSTMSSAIHSETGDWPITDPTVLLRERFLITAVVIGWCPNPIHGPLITHKKFWTQAWYHPLWFFSFRPKLNFNFLTPAFGSTIFEPLLCIYYCDHRFYQILVPCSQGKRNWHPLWCCPLASIRYTFSNLKTLPNSCQFSTVLKILGSSSQALRPLLLPITFFRQTIYIAPFDLTLPLPPLLTNFQAKIFCPIDCCPTVSRLLLLLAMLSSHSSDDDLWKTWRHF